MPHFSNVNRMIYISGIPMLTCSVKSENKHSTERIILFLHTIWASNLNNSLHTVITKEHFTTKQMISLKKV